MRVDMIVKASGLPKGTFSLIEPEIQKRLSVLDPDVCVRIRKGENNHLDIMERDKTIDSIRYRWINACNKFSYSLNLIRIDQSWD